MTADLNVLQVDLEDYYCDTPWPQWSEYRPRIVVTTRKLLKNLRQFGATATFFMLGYVADRHPDLVRDIMNEGHEIGSHGFYHRNLHRLSPSELEDEVRLSLNKLYELGAEKVLGFRAPQFSISRDTLWAFRVLRKYFRYDSSIFPVKTPLYAFPDAPRFPYHPSSQNPMLDDPSAEFLEVPLSTYMIPHLGVNVPAGGGFYLRFFPISLMESLLKAIGREGKPLVFYIHPSDLDPNQPRIAEYAWFHYWGLGSAERKLRTILSKFRFASTREVFHL
jgi:polysaccharide deacetylase family protein (PEP-CTERM system associated)